MKPRGISSGIRWCEVNIMSEQINWYKELSWIGEYRFPLQRRNQDYTTLMTGWIREYCSHIDNCKSLSDETKGRIATFANHLLECHARYLDSQFADAYTLFNQTMDEVQDSLLSVGFGMQNGYTTEEVVHYFRIRKGDKSHSYLEMLHIPLSKRQYASTGRFSAPGMPCSYLASAKEICWYECEMPPIFQLAEYKVKSATEDKKKLLRLDINPLILRNDLINLHQKGDVDEDSIKKISERIFFVMPLIAMCSVSARKSNYIFIEEYVIPQMLMAWLRNSSSFVGVRYYSYSANELVRCNTGHNIAIPVRDEIKNGYSSEICALFDFAEDMTSETIDLSDKLQRKFSQELATLESYFEEVTYQRQHFKKEDDLSRSNATVELYSRYCSICKTLLALLNDFTTNTVQSSYGIVLTLAEIQNWGYLLKEDVMNHRNDYDESANRYIDCFNEDILGLMHSISTFLEMGIVWDN